MPGKFLLLLFTVLVVACRSENHEVENDLFAKENLVAWCVVPFDSVKRNPKERAAMLRELGFSKFAYDWRQEHLPLFTEEIKTLNAEGIELSAIWIWIEPDSTGFWDETTERVLQLIDDNGLKTRLWVGYSNNYYDGLTDEEKLEKAVASVNALYERATTMGCTMSLYNHGDWFGDPVNQIRIIELSGKPDIGMVYNFHHAHDQVERYPELLSQMLPYLTTVNINGMRKEGPKILPVGAGNLEANMLEQLIKSGYDGTVGILGHVEDADVKVVLSQNLAGLREVSHTLQMKN